jgi:hypothetical protein
MPPAPPRLRAADRISDEIPPVPGRSPSTAAQYAIETEKIRAVSAAAPVAAPGPGPGLVPMLVPAPKSSSWRTAAFAMLGLVVVAGGVLAYLFGTMPYHPLSGGLIATSDRPPGETGPRPVVEPLGDQVGDQSPLSAPVIPLQPPEKGKPVEVVAAKPDSKTPNKAETKTAAAADSGTKVAMVPAKDSGHPTASRVEPGSTAGKLEPGAVAKPNGGVKVVAKAPVGPHPTGEPAAVPSSPRPPTPVAPQVKVATSPTPPPTPAVSPPKAPNTPVVAVKPQPKTWEVVALNEPPKPPVQRSVTIAGSPPAPPEADSSPGLSSNSRGTRPPPAERPASPSGDAEGAAKRPASDSEALMHEAQTAFMHGDKPAAIAAALRVTQRGGEDAIKAWRFVGAAACSGRLGAMAANAYRNLRDPDHKRLLVELCQRNGLHFHDGTFSADE